MCGNTCPSSLHFSRTCRVVRSRMREGHRVAWQNTSHRLFFTTPILFVFKSSDFRSLPPQAGHSQCRSQAELTSRAAGHRTQHPTDVDNQQYLLRSSWQAKSSVLDHLCSHNLRRHLSVLLRRQHGRTQTPDEDGVPSTRDEHPSVISISKRDLLDSLDWHGWLPGEEPGSVIHKLVLPCLPHLSSLHITVDGTTCPRALYSIEHCSSLFSLVPRLITLSVREESEHGTPDPMLHLKHTSLLLPHLSTLYVLNARLSLIDLVCIAAHPALTCIRVAGISAVQAVREQYSTNGTRQPVAHIFPS